MKTNLNPCSNADSHVCGIACVDSVVINDMMRDTTLWFNLSQFSFIDIHVAAISAVTCQSGIQTTAYSVRQLFLHKKTQHKGKTTIYYNYIFIGPAALTVLVTLYSCTVVRAKISEYGEIANNSPTGQQTWPDDVHKRKYAQLKRKTLSGSLFYFRH